MDCASRICGLRVDFSQIGNLQLNAEDSSGSSAAL
jgi:hypothetical protein